MFQWMNKMIDKISESLAHRKGLIPLMGALLILVNFILVIFSSGWLVQSNFFLHLGILVAIIGLLLMWIL